MNAARSAPPQARSAEETRLYEFAHQQLNSLVKWDIGRFYNENPFAVEPAETTAAWSRRTINEVAPALESLAETGLLIVETLEQARVFRLTDDAALRERLAEFVTACDNRELRAALIHYVLELGY